MTVARVCVRDVDLVDADESAWVAAERMHQRSVGTLVVLNEANEPLGIVTDRDLVVEVMAKGVDPQTTTVAQIMTSPVHAVSEETPIEQALSLMRSQSLRRLPVVDGTGKLIGLLSLDDVLMLLCEEFETIGRLLERQTPRAAADT